MIGNWENIKFGTIASFRNGLNFTKNSHGKGLKLIGVPDFQDYFKPVYRSLSEISIIETLKEDDYLKKGDILFVRSNGNKALVGRSLFIDKPITAVFSGFCIRARIISKGVCPLFYAYFSRTEKFRALLSAASGGTNIQNLNQKILNNVLVPRPPIEIQQKIASILSAYDDLIENNLRRIDLNCELAETMFLSLFNNKVNWGEFELNEVSKYFGRGVTPKYEEGTGLYGINQKANKGLTLNKDVFKEYRKGDWIPVEKYASKGDVLINSLGEGTIGRVHYYMGDNKKFPVDQHISIFRAKNMAVGLFVFQFFNSEYGQGHLHTLKKGGTNMTMLNIGDLRKVRIRMPSSDILENYYKSVIDLFKAKAILEKKNELLKEARDILLPRLMTGMIDPSEISGQVMENLDLEEIKEQPLDMVAEDELNYSREK
ncbi:restriction endonuclease subunit S [Christiangramia sediminis]|uniref:Restriction endonuclease subunit S n=1 Tax=Christiangramia sediminis TaxID=2881336 RepID=A0A9X1LJN7_9FLAO|nr:restriction endonuclease subunit S [Christiangramia sediminis]MCB7481606.1 restriction endonuclease subunit S [Christiangramia sediminis]